jgi:hypothetical protein
MVEITHTEAPSTAKSNWEVASFLSSICGAAVLLWPRKLWLLCICAIPHKQT